MGKLYIGPQPGQNPTLHQAATQCGCVTVIIPEDQRSRPTGYSMQWVGAQRTLPSHLLTPISQTVWYVHITSRLSVTLTP